MVKATPPSPKPVDAATAATMKAFGKRVEQVRNDARLTREEVARRARLAPAYMWRVEEGRQNIQIQNIAKIAGAMGVSLAELFADVPAITPKDKVADAVKPITRK